MSWLLNLYETYEANQDRVGRVEKKYNDQEYTLLPVCHTTQNAHIEVNVTSDGQFHSAFVIDKNDVSTLIPCTEESASRAGSKIAPYPLHDKLSYVAGDYVAYGGEIKNEEPFTYYIKQLGKWANSKHSNDKIKSIHQYLQQGRLIADLVDEKVLYVDDQQRLIDKWDAKYEHLSAVRPAIFGVVAGEQTSAFVRFNVYAEDGSATSVWKDAAVYDSFIAYYNELLGEEDICYVTGQRRPSTDRHANKIRNSGDKAKLISANDNSGFTFRGRFNSSNEAASISYDVSQKAHNALKWLINRQAKIVDGRVFLVWGNQALDLPDLNEDTFALEPNVVTVKERVAHTFREHAEEFAKALAGRRNELSKRLDAKSQVNILVLDSATTGRLAVLYYRNLDIHLYLDKLLKWHTTCVWLHRYRKNEQNEFVVFYGAPSTKDIAFAAYGQRAGDKVIKGLMERMLPTILDGRVIPSDIMNSAVRRASNPVALDKWEWEKTLSITCALINRTEGKEVALETENNQRDYLFGRLLAVADVLERYALGADESRATNAIRHMNSYSRFPARTWHTIQQSLQPYQARLGTKATHWNKIIDEVANRIPSIEFNNKPLSSVYLLGFYSQRYELYQSNKSKSADAAATGDEQE